jgi:hypothetical protein
VLLLLWPGLGLVEMAIGTKYGHAAGKWADGQACSGIIAVRVLFDGLVKMITSMDSRWGREIHATDGMGIDTPSCNGTSLSRSIHRWHVLSRTYFARIEIC